MVGSNESLQNTDCKSVFMIMCHKNAAQVLRLAQKYIFTVNEYNKLVNSDCWIARKFDESVDSEIFDMLDEYCCKYSSY